MKILAHSLEGGTFEMNNDTKKTPDIGTWSRVKYAIQMSKRAFPAGVLVNLALPYDLYQELKLRDLEGKWWWADIETHNETKKVRTERGPKEMTIAVVDEVEFYGLADFADFENVIKEKFSGEPQELEKQYEVLDKTTGELTMIPSAQDNQQAENKKKGLNPFGNRQAA